MFYHKNLEPSLNLYLFFFQIVNFWGGLRFLIVCTQEMGGGHSDAYCVQQGGGGGSKNRRKMRM